MNRQSNTDPSTHFKMYKSGKKWMFAGLTAVTLLTTTGAVAHAADNAPATSAQPVAATNNQSNNDSNSASSAAQSTVSSASATPASSATTPESQASSTVTSAATPASSQASEQKQATPATPQATSASQENTTDLNSLHFSNNASQQAFIQSVAPGAIEGWNKYKVLPSVTVAQAIVESGWGRSGLSTQAHNLFGIKGSYNGNSITMRTREVYNGRSVYVNANFRAYANNSESVADHGLSLIHI